MTPLLRWATRWGIPHAALSDLMATLGAGHAAVPPPPGSSRSEAGVQAAVRLEHARRTGGRLWRNNSGVAQREDGTPVRYGLCNDTKQVNRVCKSGDLVGITPTRCQCGLTHGLFTNYEVKHPGWVYSGDKPCRCKPGKPICDPCHEKAQFAYIKLVVSMGGIGRFITRVEDL